MEPRHAHGPSTSVARSPSALGRKARRTCSPTFKAWAAWLPTSSTPSRRRWTTRASRRAKPSNSPDTPKAASWPPNLPQTRTYAPATTSSQSSPPDPQRPPSPPPTYPSCPTRTPATSSPASTATPHRGITSPPSCSATTKPRATSPTPSRAHTLPPSTSTRSGVP